MVINHFQILLCKSLPASTTKLYYQKNPEISPVKQPWTHYLRKVFNDINDKPFLRYFLPLFQNKSWCTMFHLQMSIICKTMNLQEKSFPYESLCTKTRSETEVRATRKWPFPKVKPFENYSLNSLIIHDV